MLSSLRAALAIGAALAGLGIAVALGNWQLRRAAERSAVEAAWAAAREAAPVSLRVAADLETVAGRLPRHVRAVGHLEHEQEVWLDNRPLDGRAGFLVVTPLRLRATSERILVIRGWAPRDPRDRARLPDIRRPDGEVQIEGVAIAHAPRLFEFSAAAGGREAGPIRQNLDVDAIGAGLGAPIAPFVIQQTAPLSDSLERRAVAPASGAERNRAYAVQWFALAGLCGVLAAGMSVHFYRSRNLARTTT